MITICVLFYRLCSRICGQVLRKELSHGSTENTASSWSLIRQVQLPIDRANQAAAKTIRGQPCH
jgi:hypothetical protein